MEANDPGAICHMSCHYCKKGDHKWAFEYFTKAVALGNVECHYLLALYYWEGESVEKDEKKFIYHAEQAAIG